VESRRKIVGSCHPASVDSVGMRRPALVLFGVALMWGSVGTVVREIPLPAAVVAAGRTTIGAIVLGLVMLTGRVPGPPLFSQQRARLVLVGAVLAAHWLCLMAAYQHMAVATVIFIVYVAPVLVAVLAPAVLGERIDRQSAFALLVAAAGFAVLARPTGTTHTTTAGLWLSAGAAATFAMLVLVSKPVAAVYGGVRTAFVQLLVASVFLAPVAARAAWGSPRVGWWWLVVLGVVHTGLAMAVYAGALARLPAVRVGTIAYVEPVAAAVCAWAVLGERPAGAVVVGGAFILAAGLALVRVDARAGRAAVLEGAGLEGPGLEAARLEGAGR